MLDPAKLKSVKELSRSGFHFCLARPAGSSRLWFGSSDGKVCDVDLAADKPQFQEIAAHESYVTGLALIGNQLVSAGYEGRLTWWDASTRAQVRSVAAHDRWIRDLAATPDGKLIVTIADDMQTKIWNAESGELVVALANHLPQTPHHYPSMLYAVAISANGNLLATGDKVGHVVVSELPSGKKLAELEAPVMYTWDPTQRRHSIGGIRSLAFSPDGKHLAVGGMGKVGNIDHLEGLARVEIFDWQAGMRLHEFPGDKAKGLVERLLYHPDGDWVLATGGDGKGFFHFYDPRGGKLLHQTEAPMHVHSVSLDVEAGRLYAVGSDRIGVWAFG